MSLSNNRKSCCLLYAFIAVIFATILTIHFVQKWWEVEQFKRITIEHLRIKDYGGNDRDPEVSCKFPLPSPLAHDVMAYFDKASTLQCPWFKKLFWTEIDRGTLKLNLSAYQPSYWYPCRYSEITRPESDHYVIYGPFLDLVHPVVPQSDFVYVECNNVFGYPLYQDYHAYAQRNLSIRKFKTEDELSIAMIGLDSMSRMNFIRQMPQAYDYLQNELGAVTMLGFNKVGRNTFPNLIPMLTGRPPPPPPYGHFESFRYVWDEFADAGAVTTYAEDWPTQNMFVNWGQGLKKKPTHHYLHTFYRAFQNTFMAQLSMPHCLGWRPLHHHYFSYLMSALRVYADSPSFLFSLHNDLSHDEFNTPQILDSDFKDFLKSAHDEGLLNRTILVVFGDHGQRMDNVRVTVGGRTEDMMPLVSIVMPKHIRPEWVSALRKNRHRLLSSYDFYPTFLDVLSTLVTANMSFIESAKQKTLGRSLFSDIPKNRTCEDANIEDWFCTCIEDVNTVVPKEQVECRHTVSSWIQKINRELIDKKKCAELRLRHTSGCKQKPSTNDTWTYLVNFMTDPGGAYFEATAHWTINETSRSLTSLGKISRLNQYNHQSYCIHKNIGRDALLKELCYCLSYFNF